jgi:undecaprenyl-diphosphatase
MIREIILAIVQGITEFLPISSSGHLAIISKLISEPNLFFMVAMHFASLLAILIYFRKDIFKLFHFRKKENWNWYKTIFIGIIPAGLVGYFFSDLIDKAINNYALIGTGFLFSTLILLSSKINFGKKKKITFWDSLIIGLSQVFALFPGVSRSGTTTSTGMLRKIKPEIAGKFSFLIFIPLMIGAMIQQIGEFYINLEIIVAFIVCFFVSLSSLGLFFKTLKSGKFWLFAVWTGLMAILSYILYLF